MLNGGCVIPDSGKLPTMATEFQFHLLSLQRQMERSFVRVAAGASRPAVVILDRCPSPPLPAPSSRRSRVRLLRWG